MKKDAVRQTLLTGARRQKVIIEYRDDSGPEWWAMFHDGAIRVFDTAAAALKVAQKAASRRNPGITITVIEWRNVPPWFKPPKRGE